MRDKIFNFSEYSSSVVNKTRIWREKKKESLFPFLKRDTRAAENNDYTMTSGICELTLKTRLERK